MKTIVGRFQSAHDARGALNELASYNLGKTETAGQDANGHLRKQVTAGKTFWDAISQLGIVAGIVLGAFIGLLAGTGTLASMGIGEAPQIINYRSIWAGLLVGGSMGVPIGCILGVALATLIPERDHRFYAYHTRVNGMLVSVQTQDHWANEAISVLRGAHAVDVKVRSGRVEADEMAEMLQNTR